MAYEELVLERRPLDDMSNVTGRFAEVYVGGRIHQGVDIGVVEGTPIYAGRDGVVVPHTNDGSYGLSVVVDYPRTEWYLMHAHLSRINVSMGQVVAAGTLLGLSGNTGLSTGPHLHWEASKTTTFPRDITQKTDPMLFRVVPRVLPPPPPPPLAAPFSPAQLVALQGIIDQRVSEIVTNTSGGIWRLHMQQYWLNAIGGDFTDSQGNEIPPDRDVVDAIRQYVASSDREQLAAAIEHAAKGLSFDIRNGGRK